MGDMVNCPNFILFPNPSSTFQLTRNEISLSILFFILLFYFKQLYCHGTTCRAPTASQSIKFFSFWIKSEKSPLDNF